MLIIYMTSIYMIGLNLYEIILVLVDYQCFVYYPEIRFSVDSFGLHYLVPVGFVSGQVLMVDGNGLLHPRGKSFFNLLK